MSEHDGYVAVAKAADLPAGEALCVQIADRRIAVFNVDGVFHAVDDECPHEGAPLSDGYIAAGCVTCPHHAWEFDLKTGAFEDDPEVCLQTYDVQIVGDDILLRLPVAVDPAASD